MWKISIALCTYNGERFIEEQLESIFNQTILPNEIIICDDQSTDSTVLLLEKLKNKSNIPIKIYINQENLGYIKNFEKCIGLCDGDIIYLADQDDYWIENKIETTLKEFNKNPNLQILFTDATLVDDNLQPLPGMLWGNLSFDPLRFPTDRQGRIGYLCKRSIATGATMAIKKELYFESIPFSKDFVHDEWLLWNAIIKNKEFKPLNKPLIAYRQHASNQIGVKKLQLTNLLKSSRDLEKHITKNSFLIQYVRKNYCSEKEVSYLIERLEFLESRNALFNNRVFRLGQLIMKFLFDKKYNLKNYSTFFNGKKTIFSDLFRK
ncbi:glycosyltransferase family 2 protein [Solibacillus sp. FSL R7-0668]|uniref:glycosyltransferase family 2 protein n=1 Tax=Solibacillus sp. FSL R7-0668 TaxID=2921688 RepID=UPI0030F56069